MNKKIILFAGIEILLVVMVWVTFGSLGNLSGLLNDSALAAEANPIINRMYIFQTLFFFSVFLIFLAMIVHEVWHIKKVNLEKSKLVTEDLNLLQTEQTEDTEEAIREKERLALEEAKQREKVLAECIDKFMAQGKTDDQKKTSEGILRCISQVFEITQAEIFIREKGEDSDKIILSATYAFYIPEEKVFEFQIGEGLIGQVAKAGTYLYLDDLPEGYITVKSGLGSATPNHLLIVPWKNQDGDTMAVLELASFKPFHLNDIQILESLATKISAFYS